MPRLIATCGVLMACVCGAAIGAGSPGEPPPARTVGLAVSQDNPFLGRWDITAKTAKESYPYWLEVKEENGQLTGTFQDRGGAVRKLAEIAREGNELVFSLGAPRANAPKPVHRAHVENGRLIGQLTTGPNTVAWIGVRPPKWGNRSANGPHKFGRAVTLFNGRDLAGWTFQFTNEPSGWVVADGAMTNEQTGNNIVSERRFEDFKLSMEYRVDKDSNSGLYLRGRYELQVLDDAGKPTSPTGNMAVYGRVAPSVNASKPAGEWQTVEATLVGNRVTVVLNGRTIHDDVAIDGITGGALDSNEAEPGPIMIQGDHSRVWVRKLVVTPIL